MAHHGIQNMPYILHGEAVMKKLLLACVIFGFAGLQAEYVEQDVRTAEVSEADVRAAEEAMWKDICTKLEGYLPDDFETREPQDQMECVQAAIRNRMSDVYYNDFTDEERREFQDVMEAFSSGVRELQESRLGESAIVRKLCDRVGLPITLNFVIQL